MPDEVAYVQKLRARRASRRASSTASASSLTSLSAPLRWTPVLDEDSGDYYYVNNETQETTWERPPGVPDPASDPSGALRRRSSVGTRRRGSASVVFSATDGTATVDSPWQLVPDADSGSSYYFNTETGESTWEKPADLRRAERRAKALSNASQGDSDAASAGDAGQPSGEGGTQKHKHKSRRHKNKPIWKATTDEATGKTYYYNRKTRRTTWSKPPDLDADERDAAPSAEPFSLSKAQEDAKAEGLPAGWIKNVDRATGRQFCFNTETEETKWTRPASATVTAASEAKGGEDATTSDTAPADAAAEEGAPAVLSFPDEASLPPPPPFRGVPKVYRSIAADPESPAVVPRFRFKTHVPQLNARLRTPRDPVMKTGMLVVRRDARDGRKAFAKRYAMLHDQNFSFANSEADAATGNHVDAIRVYGAVLLPVAGDKLQLNIWPVTQERIVSLRFKDEAAKQDWTAALQRAGASLRT